MKTSCFTKVNQTWYILTGVLCVYGLFKEVRPVEPFLSKYLTSSPKNNTIKQLDDHIYPVWTYTYLAALIPVFLCTDLVRYKFVILFESLCYLTTWSILIWGSDMRYMEMTYGFATATEIAYYSYIYAAIDEKHYQRATSYVRGAVVLGRTLSAALSQIIVWQIPIPEAYFVLNYISLGSMAFIFFVALVLPNVQWKMSNLFPDENGKELKLINVEFKQETSPSFTRYATLYFKQLPINFAHCYRSSHVVKWSIWWALATCGYFQIINYNQNLWEVVDSTRSYNGLVELVNNFSSENNSSNDCRPCLIFSIWFRSTRPLRCDFLSFALVSSCFQFLQVRWDIYGEMTIGLMMFVDGVLLSFSSYTNNIWFAYAVYIIYSSTYQLLITIATYNVAIKLKTHNYGLVLGFNTFMALVFQTILTLIVNTNLNLGIRSQFLVYGYYHFGISFLFSFMGCYIFGHWHGIHNSNKAHPTGNCAQQLRL